MRTALTCWKTCGWLPEHLPNPIPLPLPSSQPSPGRPWRMLERLTEDDITAIVSRFAAGETRDVLAKDYGISVKSVARLLQRDRQHKKKAS
jgi:hypothetical protein